jgi:hypothetical protein
MENKIKIMSDEQLFKIMEQWQAEMPDQQFFVNLPATVQIAAAKTEKPWWSVVLAPLSVTSYVLAVLLSFGVVNMHASIKSNKNMSMAAANWVSEKYGWSNIDEALEIISGEVGANQNNTHVKYLSTLEQGTYLDGTDNAIQMLDNLSDTELDALLSELQDTRS